MNNWKKIWNKNERVNEIILDMLIKADGFDSPTGGFILEDWTIYTNDLYKKISIQENDSIFEVGCGCGAFIYPLYLKGHKVGGVDYSKILISLAKPILTGGDFKNQEATEIEEKIKYDILISHGVFCYFDNLDYAKKVIEKMIRKANKNIAILDINDKKKQAMYHDLRMQTMTKDDYKQKYAGLEHLFYTKDFFINIAKEHDLDIEIWDQSFEKYNNSKFRFNVIMRKK